MRRRLDAVLQIGLLIALAEAYRLLRRLIPTDWPLAISNAHHVFRLVPATTRYHLAGGPLLIARPLENVLA